MIAYRDHEGLEHLAIVKGDPRGKDILCRIHSECLTGDVFGSQRCDCGPQLALALQRIERAGVGAVVYLRQEGRGIGLVNKLRAYALQERGIDTLDANLALGFAGDLRSYDSAAQILTDLGVGSVRLMTNNPEKVSDLKRSGVMVSARVDHLADVNEHNHRYLKTKQDRMGHLLSLPKD